MDNRRFILQNFGIASIKTIAFSASTIFTPPLPGGFDDNGLQQDVLQQDTPQYSTIFGTPMWQYLKFLGDQYYVPNSLTPITYPDLYIDTVLIEASQDKHIVKTEIQGRNGSVKEYIGLGDYNFTLRGCLSSPKGSRAYPKDEVAKFVQVMQVPESIQVSAPLINLFTNYIVIESFQLMESEGLRNLQFFEIKCCSDTPIELTI